LEVKDIISKISFVFNKTITPNTYIFLDEIQECPNARRSLKFFKEDKTYHVIASGSLLGVNLSINKLTKDEPSSIAVGSEKHFVMKPLDFEEFLWNNNISEQDIELLRKYYLEKKRIPKIYFEKYFDLLNKYTIVGGMPEAVVEFLERNDLETVKSIHKKIMISYRDDIAKYATNDQKVKARNIYDSLTYQLSKENTKFKFSLIDKSAKIHKAEYLTAIN
jgi:predicted AAA+ superfamily ATPase